MDGRSIQILEKLRKDSRLSVSKISKVTGNPRNMVLRRIKFIDKYLIKKYTSIINFKKLDYKLRVRFLLKSKNKRMILFLSKNRHTNSISAVKGKFDYHVEAFFRNLSEFNDFDEKLKRFCREKREHFIVEDIKEEDFING